MKEDDTFSLRGDRRDAEGQEGKNSTHAPDLGIPLLTREGLCIEKAGDRVQPMASPFPRLAVRALILQDDRLLLVNAWGGDVSDLWCAPGGGVERGASLPENLAREVHEETGLVVEIGAPCLVNEFHEPSRGFHQVDVYFRAKILSGAIDEAWADPEGIVTKRRFFTRAEMAGIRYKPDMLPDAAWGDGVLYDPLELLVR